VKDRKLVTDDAVIHPQWPALGSNHVTHRCHVSQELSRSGGGKGTVCIAEAYRVDVKWTRSSRRSETGERHGIRLPCPALHWTGVDMGGKAWRASAMSELAQALPSETRCLFPQRHTECAERCFASRVH
jgi:hypothetical protein